MTIDRSEALKDRLKSIAVCLTVGAIAVFVVASNPKNQGKFFVMQNLSPGAVAPDIVGVDVNGKPMKLSDYRGKVVMLDFFGNW